MKNDEFKINGSGKQVRDILFVEDLYRLFERIIDLGSQVKGTFNVGGGQENSLSILELFEILSEKTGNFPRYENGSTRPYDQLVYISDNTKVTRATGWRPGKTYIEGLVDLISWTRERI